MALGACTPAAVARQACYAESEASFVQQAYVACQAKGLEWLECPDRPRLLVELTDKERACP